MNHHPTDQQTDNEGQNEDQMEGTSEQLAEEDVTLKLMKAGADFIDAEDNAYKSSDQDIDTAGTEADTESKG